MIHQFYTDKATIDSILRGKRIHPCPYGEVKKGQRIRLSDGQIFVYLIVCKVFSLGAKQTVEVSWINAGPEEIRKQDEAPEMGADSSFAMRRRKSCKKCGCDLIHPDGPLCMPCDIG